MTISTWPPSPDLLPRPRLHRHPAAPVIRWRPVEVPPPSETEQLAAWCSDLGRLDLI